jgi:hypothetical protein
MVWQHIVQFMGCFSYAEADRLPPLHLKMHGSAIKITIKVYSYVCNFIPLTWRNISHFKDFWAHSVDGQLDPSPVAVSMAVVLVLLILSPVIQFLCYHSLLHSVLALSVSEHSPLWSPLSHSPTSLLYWSVVYCLHNVKLFRVAISSKNNMNPSVLF